MSGWAERLAAVFLAPAEAEGPEFAPPEFAPPRARPPLAGVLAPAADLAVAAGAAAAALRGEARASAVLVCVWDGGEEAAWAAPVPGAPAAARLASKLARRGAAARACGTLCVVTLPADAAQARGVARDAIAAAEVPAVLALSRRDAALDELLLEADRVLLALDPEAGAALAEVAEADLARLGRPVRRLSLPRAFGARQVARLGLGPRAEPGSPAATPPVVAKRFTKPSAEDGFASRVDGQAAILLVGAMFAALLLAVVLGGVARGIGVRGETQRAVDLAALAGARAMLDAYPRLFAAPDDPGHLEKAAYLEIGRAAALDVAARNGIGPTRRTAATAPRIEIGFPDAETIAPVRIRVRLRRPVAVTRGEAAEETAVAAVAEAELSPDTGGALAAGGGYDGPLAYRQGKPMRPDVAKAFDRMAAAARADGVALLITSAFRSDAEQAILWARRPDPRWVAPPGKSLHRNGTELDLGPPGAYGWLAANAPRFHFVKRYAWEPWHFGFSLNARSTPSEHHTTSSEEHDRIPAPGSDRRPLPDFVPRRFAAPIARAAQRWNVSGILLAAQLHAESGFNPFARSSAGAQGIAQFMPGTARAYGLSDPFDAERAIDAQARMMRDLLRRFGSVPLALAAYNAGPARVAACACVPPIPETRGYVARILGLMGGAGEAVAAGGLSVRLVR